jgi:hypothetical protein
MLTLLWWCSGLHGKYTLAMYLWPVTANFPRKPRQGQCQNSLDAGIDNSQTKKMGKIKCVSLAMSADVKPMFSCKHNNVRTTYFIDIYWPTFVGWSWVDFMNIFFWSNLRKTFQAKFLSYNYEQTFMLKHKIQNFLQATMKFPKPNCN